MNRRDLLKYIGTILPVLYLSKSYQLLANTTWCKVPFEPNWDSLENYKVPKWFRDAKFGIWAHWGPQCQPDRGDWYARGIYQEGSDQYTYHIEKYGHPSKFGFKDVINIWKAEKWNPEVLMDLYKRTGTQYFMTLANHHDNLDLYKSKHHAWNSLNFGPKRDVVGEWEKAARKRGLRFGVSVHATHAWTWYETAQRTDKEGPMKAIPYDGKLTQADGKGTWWEGYDIQKLYAQNHELSKDSLNNHKIHQQWHWDVNSGVSIPSEEYCINIKNRTIDLIDSYNPDLVYFDDKALPLWPVSYVGLEIAANYYNKSVKENKGKLDVVITGKILNKQQRKCMVWDIECGQSNRIESQIWQTCTCIGGWHYDRRIYDNDHYKSAKTVIHMLVDVVSKNGNLLLSVPLRGDGSLDDKTKKTVEGIADWMQINRESIIGTRPWHTFGESPAIKDAPALQTEDFNEGKGKPLTSSDIRFTQKGKNLYAIVMGIPETASVQIQSLGRNSENTKLIKKVTLLGYTKSLKFNQTDQGLTVIWPDNLKANDIAQVLKLT